MALKKWLCFEINSKVVSFLESYFIGKKPKQGWEEITNTPTAHFSKVNI